MTLARSPRILVAVSFVWWSLAGWADPVLPTLFTDHMVLQRGRPIRVWGRADAGEKLKVDLAGHKGTTTADASGRWSLFLPALSAGGPFNRSISPRGLLSFGRLIWILVGSC